MLITKQNAWYERIRVWIKVCAVEGNELPMVGLGWLSKHKVLLNNSFTYVSLLLDCFSIFQGFNFFPHKLFSHAGSLLYFDAWFLMKISRILFRKYVFYGKIVLIKMHFYINAL